MPGKDALAEGFRRWEFRSGYSNFSWRGIVSEGDPSTIQPNALRMALNARIVGGEYRERPGLAKLFTDALGSSSHAIRDIVSYDPVRPLKLWFIGNGCPGVSTSLGFSLGSMDQEQSPETQRNTYYSAGTATSLVFAKFNGRLFVGVGPDFSEYQYIRQPWGIEAIAVSGASQNTLIKTFTGFSISCMLEFDGKLWIGLDNGAGVSKVASYDGVSIRDEKTAIDAPTTMALYRVQNGGDALMVATSTTNTVYIRPAGSSAVWSSIGNTAATVVKMVAYKDVLYMAAGVNISTWNGTALVDAAHAPASATAVRALALFNGLLYFGYETATPSARIGKYDATTWTDVEKNLTTQFAGTTSVRTLADYRGFLVAMGTRSGEGRIWASPLTVTSGTWTQITPPTSGGGVGVGTIFDAITA